jgi:hypothetical protein
VAGYKYFRDAEALGRPQQAANVVAGADIMGNQKNFAGHCFTIAHRLVASKTLMLYT